MEGVCELCRSEGRTRIQNTALIHAAREGHENCLRLLVDAGADVNFAVENISDEDRPLVLAAGNGNVNCVRMLIEAGADVNAKTKDSYTAVHGAVRCGNEACLDLLVKAGADVNVSHGNELYGSEPYGTPLEMICCEGKHLHLVKPLLNAGAKMEESMQEKPLLLAACAGHFQFIEALIQAGADVNSRGIRGITSLMYAASATEIEIESDQTGTVNNIRCLDLLLKAGADVNMVDRQGFSALLHAAIIDNCYSLKYLLQAGADVNIRSETKGETALMLVTRQEQTCSECTAALIATGADVNIASHYGATPIIYAADNGSSKCIETLIKAGANVNQTTTSGFTAMMYAAECGYHNCIRILINSGADVNIALEDGSTALFRAGNVKSVQVLLDSGAKINIHKKNGWNALQNWIMTRWCKSHRKVITCLFAAGETTGDGAAAKILVAARVEESGIALKHLCRDVIRNHLLGLNPHAHLFDRVPQLGLPEMLRTYLLYNQSLDKDDDDNEIFDVCHPSSSPFSSCSSSHDE